MHVEVERLTAQKTMLRFRGDLSRRLTLEDKKVTFWNTLCLFTKAGVLGVLFFRLNDWFYERRWRIAVRLMERLIFLVTRSELQAGAKIGVGLVLPDEGTVGITSAARIGANCTFHAMSTVIMWSSEDGKAEASNVVIGDYCVIGRRARIFGNIQLGDGTQVKPNSLVLASFTRPGTVLSGIPARRRAQIPLEAVCAWNPIKGHALASGSNARRI